jgi:hypothetical protein
LPPWQGRRARRRARSATQKEPVRQRFEGGDWQRFLDHAALQQKDSDLMRIPLNWMVKISFTSICYSNPILLL